MKTIGGRRLERIKDILTTEELEDAAAGYKRLAGLDKDALNSRRSIVDAKKAVIPPQGGSHASGLNPCMGGSKLCRIVDWTSNRGMGPVLKRDDRNERNCRRFRPGSWLGSHPYNRSLISSR